MWQLFILTFLSVKIQFDQVWSKSDPKKIKNQITIYILMVNVTTFYTNIFIGENPIWSSLIKVWSKKNQKKITIFILMVNVTTVYSNNFWLVKIQFDQVWSVLDRSDPKNYFYSNIFWLVRNPIWSSLIKFNPLWTDLIKKHTKTALFILFVK